MKKTILVVVGISIFFLNSSFSQTEKNKELNKTVKLPSPKHDGKISIEKALLNRRSIRSYKEIALTLNEVSQLLWAAQGVTDIERGLRAAPSAGATYPLNIYLVSGNVKGLEKGVYKYIINSHSLLQKSKGDIRKIIFEGSLSQQSLLNAPGLLVVSGQYSITTGRYSRRGNQYVHMEIGAVAQNVYLQAESLGIGTVFIGAFNDDLISKAIGLDEGEIPFCILPVGKK